MENRPGDAFGTAWFLAAMPSCDGEPADPEDGTPPNVIIAVSLDELDDMTGDMLV